MTDPLAELMSHLESLDAERAEVKRKIREETKRRKEAARKEVEGR